MKGATNNRIMSFSPISILLLVSSLVVLTVIIQWRRKGARTYGVKNSSYDDNPANQNRINQSSDKQDFNLEDRSESIQSHSESATSFTSESFSEHMEEKINQMDMLKGSAPHKKFMRQFLMKAMKSRVDSSFQDMPSSFSISGSSSSVNGKTTYKVEKNGQVIYEGDCERTYNDLMNEKKIG